MIEFNIKKIGSELDQDLTSKINGKTKPVGSLGLMENIAFNISKVQNTLSPELKNPHLIMFAGDHGISEMGVSPCSKDVTFGMVYNFLRGGGGINVFCKQNGIEFKVVDSGVDHEFVDSPTLIDHKIAMGTQNYYNGPAMSEDQLEECFIRSAKVVDNCHNSGSNIIGFGEMGIGNTSSASLIMSSICDIPLKKCVGAGAGFASEGIEKKYNILKKAQENNKAATNGRDALRTFGGFEVAMMSGGMLRAAEHGMIIMIDGFIATASLLAAYSINPNIIDYCVFCHLSNEGGHRLMLDYLKAEPILDMRLRLGEGTACALAYPIIEASVNFINQMSTFIEEKVEDPIHLDTHTI